MPQNAVIALSIIGGVIVLLLLVLFVILFVLYNYTFYSPKKWQNNDFLLTEKTNELCDLDTVKFLITRLRNVPCEHVFISSFDKKKLHARLYRKEDSDTVVIMFHGYRGTACRDFSGGAYDMQELGFNVILADERAHGLSEGHTITFGAKEKLDARKWIDYARKEFGEDKRIILVGISMGGATVLLTSDYLKEGDLVIADCPYSTTKEILYNTTKQMVKFGTGFFYGLLNLSSIIFAHVNLNKDNADEHIKKTKAKILIIHGDSDTLVPHALSYRLKEKYPDKITYELFPGAEHGLCYLADNDRYKKVIKGFVSQKS